MKNTKPKKKWVGSKLSCQTRNWRGLHSHSTQMVVFRSKVRSTSPSSPLRQPFPHPSSKASRTTVELRCQHEKREKPQLTPREIRFSFHFAFLLEPGWSNLPMKSLNITQKTFSSIRAALELSGGLSASTRRMISARTGMATTA